MSFVNVALVVSAVATVTSGVMGYVGAQNQAAGLKQQARYAELKGKNDAQILRNNAMAQAQDEQFQVGVAKFNQRETLTEADYALQKQQDKTRMAIASAETTAARRGTLSYSFNDILRSEAMLAEREESDILYSGGQQGYQFSQQADLGGLRANRAIEIGQYDSAMALSAGNFQSSSLRGQASSAKIGGYASLVGGLAGGFSTASDVNYEKLGTLF